MEAGRKKETETIRKEKADTEEEWERSSEF
jgi:hypothetical protein